MTRARRFATIASLLLAAACASQRTKKDVAAAPRGTVELAPASADVWGFSVFVSARVVGDEHAAACSFLVRDRPTDGARQGATFTATLDLEEGENVVVAVCRDERGRESRSAEAVYTGRLADAPEARAVATLAGQSLLLDGSSSRAATHSPAPLARFSWLARRGLGGAAQPVGEGSRLEVPAPAADGEYTYALRVTDARGRSDDAAIAVDVARGTPAVAARPGAPEPAWAEAGVVYGVIPPLFGSPPLRAVRAALPDLQRLGVAALWLSPIFEAAPGDFGYAVTDYLRVRHDYGTLDDLHALVTDAHARGLRVLLDFVPNHTSDEHPYFHQAAALGRRSHYYDFYERGPDGAATHYFDWNNLPNLAYGNPEVRSFMTAVALDWLRDAGVDGYRVDAAWGVRAREPSFFARWIADVARVEPRAFVVAEASAREPFYAENGFSAAYDWTEELGHAAWEHVFDAKDGIAARLRDAVETTRRAGNGTRPFRFLNDNDTGARFITRHGIELTRVATVALLTLPGVPLLYTFDEGGAEFEPYDERPPPARAPHPELVQFHRELVRLRRDLPALHGPVFEALHGGTNDDGFVYLRRAGSTSGVAIVALNFGGKTVTVALDVPKDAGKNALRPALASPGSRHAGSSVVLPPFGYEILVSE